MSFDLTNKNIQDTYQNLLQKTGSDGRLYDLVGNQVRDLTIDGTLTANTYITSESIVNTSSGSTAFGNSSVDSHTFQGSITASGDISSSGTYKGDGAGLTNIPASGIVGLNLSRIVSGSLTASIAPNKGFEVNTNITASGNISASGTSHTFGGDVNIISSSKSDNVSLVIRNSSQSGSTNDKATLKFGHVDKDGGKIVSDRSAAYSNDASRRAALEFYTTQGGNDTKKLTISDNAGHLTIHTGSLILTGNDGIVPPYGTGHISASGHLYVRGSGSFGSVNVLTGTGSFGYITSNEISSSGKLFALGADFGDSNILNVGQIDVDQIADDATGGDTAISLDGTSLDIDVGGGTILEMTSTKADFSVPIKTTSNITASGNISSSGGNITLGKLKVVGNETTLEGTHFHLKSTATQVDNYIGGASGNTTSYIQFGLSNKLQLFAKSEQMIEMDGNADIITFGDGGDIAYKFRTLNDDNTLYISGSSDKVGIGTDTPGEKLEVIGNISASGTITAEHFLSSDDAKITDDLEVQGNYSGSAASTLQVGGAVTGKMKHMFFHSGNWSSGVTLGGVTTVYIPLNSTVESSTLGEQHQIIAPFNGTLLKIVFRALGGSNPGNMTAKFQKNGSVEVTESITGVTVGNNAVFSFSTNNAFNAGDVLALALNVSTDTGDFIVTSVFQFDTNTIIS